MAERILESAREDIRNAEEQLKAAKALIDRLKAAGEDTLDLERRYIEAQRRLERYKRAFGE
jgi:multidrug resistance efflux pump